MSAGVYTPQLYLGRAARRLGASSDIYNDGEGKFLVNQYIHSYKGKYLNWKKICNLFPTYMQNIV
jgi:hypothetical protein